MKHTKIFAALSISIFFSLPVFAGTEKMADSQALAASLAQASSPENVKAVALQQKTMYCAQNAKNKQLQGKEKEDYLATCMTENEALASFQSISSQRIVAGDVNEMLRKLPTAAGNNTK